MLNTGLILVRTFTRSDTMVPGLPPAAPFWMRLLRSTQSSVVEPEMITVILIRKLWMPFLPEESEIYRTDLHEASLLPQTEAVFPLPLLSEMILPPPLPTGRTRIVQQALSVTTVRTVRTTPLPEMIPSFISQRPVKNIILQAAGI